MRRLRILIACLFVLFAMPALAQQQGGTLDAPLPDPVPYNVDSGDLFNRFDVANTVHQEIVDVESAAWMRLYFGDDLQLGEGSFLRIRSALDGEVQILDQETLEMWSNTTAYFNGDRVTIEVVAGPKSSNRLVIEQMAWESIPSSPLGSGCDPGCCGLDDRVPSTVEFSGRIVPAGCSGTIYNTDSCAVSAGHCASGGMVMLFNTPPSNPNCSTNLPPIADQFPVTAFQFTNGGIGNDWLAMTMGTNNLGETPFQRYGVFKPIAAGAPTVGEPATVWGYGADNECTRNYAQQTSGGFIESLTSTGVRYSIDVTFGNSGSGVIQNDDEIVGIVTHCCCPNWGTRTDHPSFVAAREALCPTSPAVAATLVSANVTIGTPITGGIAELLSVDGSHFVVDSVTGGPRNNAMTEVVAQSPFGTLSELNVVIDYGPANGSPGPVFLLVQLFNNDTSLWDSQQFGIVATSGNTTVDLASISNPNAYLDALDQIRIRVAETAREPQTPGGFTKLIDSVQVTMKP